MSSKRILVALSGGCDSVALLLMLLEQGGSVEAAHCNFHLRGDESDRDEAFVRQLCRERGVQLHIAHFDTRAYAELHHQSIETAARNLRYHYFEQLRRDLQLDYIAVAHHRDDQAETVLMHLLRGSGLHGLTGMQERNGHIIRPLLGYSRQQLEQYLRDKGQTYVTDSTNLERQATRNRIRLDVLPLLETIYPGAADRIARCAQHLQEAETVVNAALQQQMDALITNNSSLLTPHSSLKNNSKLHTSHSTLENNSSLLTPHSTLENNSSLLTPHSSLKNNSTLHTSHSTLENNYKLSTINYKLSTINYKLLTSLPSPSLLLHAWLTPYGFTPAQTESIAQNLDAQTGTIYQSATHTLAFDRGSLTLSPTPSPLRPITIPEPGTYVLSDGRRLRVSRSPLTSDFQPSRQPSVATLDADTVCFPLTLRPAASGDRFQPYGMKGTKLVSDYLTDRHTPVLEKLRQTVLTQADSTIIWLPGHRTAHPQRITDSTTTVLTLTIL